MQRNLLSAAPLFLYATTLLSLAGCTETGSNPWSFPTQNAQTEQTDKTLPPVSSAVPPVDAAQPQQTTAKIAILLPLTGKGADAGQAMLNAAQLAMFDLNASALFELIPEDTGAGAHAAMNDATTKGANLILGPLFSDTTKTVSPMALQNGVSVVSFSTDTTAAVGNTFLMGFMPQTQVEQVMTHAASQGIKNIALIAPRDVYGDSASAAFVTTMQRYGLDNAGIVRYNAGTLPTATELAIISKNMNAVLIASPAVEAHKISNLLTAQGITNATVKRLGTGLWDSADAAKLTGLQGAWYAASSPRLRMRFEQRYFETYGAQPPRIASLAYDATALSVVLAKSGRGFGRDALTNPNGFSGIDGIFRFNQQGTTDRGLAILEINNGAASVIKEAPQRF